MLLALVAALGQLALAQPELQAQARGAPLLRQQQVDWGEQGITLDTFRRHFAADWDAVGEKIGEARQSAQVQRRNDELAELMRAAHKKLGLEGTSDPVDVAGPDSDWASRFDSGLNANQDWTWQEAADQLRDHPTKLHESGHRGQPLYSPQTQSAEGALPGDYVSPTERVRVLTKAGSTTQQRMHVEWGKLREQRQRLLALMSLTFSCAEWPAPAGTAPRHSCGTADYSRLSAEIARTERRLFGLKQAALEPLPVNAFGFESGDMFREADGDGDGLLAPAELKAWASRQAKLLLDPAHAADGKQLASDLAQPDGHLSTRPIAGTCVALVQATCPGTRGTKCEECFQLKQRRVGGALESGSKYSVCKTWGDVQQACGSGSDAADVWPGLSRQARWTMEARKRQAEGRFASSAGATQLTPEAADYINQATMAAAAKVRARLATQYAAARGTRAPTA